tara:strand:- start:406 stop:1101 length:696 start_codon:yes stop_codon:yes gene_type:complete
MMISLTVIVPFFNEEKLLELSVNRLIENNIYEKILLIDNNSTDDSYNIAQKLVDENKNIELHKTNKTKGKGAALSEARKLITTSHVVIHDADLEYFPDDISEMFKKSKEFSNSMILGSRFIGDKQRKNVYIRTILANRGMSLFFSIINLYYISDVSTCYKLMPAEFYKNITFKEKGFSIEIELLSKFLKFNRSIKEVPIKYEGRSYSEGKKIKTIDGFNYLLSTLKYRFFN